MKHSAQQVSQAWKSYLSNRHSSAQKRQSGGQIDTEKYAAQKTKGATIRFNDTNKQPQDSSLLHFFDAFTPTELNQAKGKQDSMGLFSLLKQKINLNQPDNIGVQARQAGGKIKFKNTPPNADDSADLAEYVSQKHGAPDLIDSNEFKSDDVLKRMFSNVGQVNNLINSNSSDDPYTPGSVKTRVMEDGKKVPNKQLTPQEKSFFYPKLNDGGKVKHKLKRKNKKEEKEVAVNDAQVEHGRASSATNSQHRAGGGIVEGKPGIDTNHAEIRPGSFVIPKKKVDEAINDGIVKPKKAEKFQSGGVPVKLTAGEALLSPEKAASLYHMGVDLNKYAPESSYPYTPETANTAHAPTQMDTLGLVGQLKNKIGLNQNGKVGYQDGGNVRNGAIPGAEQLLTQKDIDNFNNIGKTSPAKASVSTYSAPSSNAGAKNVIQKSKVNDIPVVHKPNPQSAESTKELADKITAMEDKYGSRPRTSSQIRNDAIQKKYDNSSLLNKGILGLGQAINDDLYYAGKVWNGIGQGMYDAGKALFYGKDDEPTKSTAKLKKGGAIKMQAGGGVNKVAQGSGVSILNPDDGSVIAQDPSLLSLGNGMNMAPAIAPGTLKPSNGLTPEQQAKFDSIDAQQTAANNAKTLPSGSTDVGNQANYTDDQKKSMLTNPNTQNSNPANPLASKASSNSLFDQAMKSQKNYYQTAGLIDTALLAGNLGSRYVPAPKPAPYNPDIYQRNLAGEQQQASKELDKVAATEQYNSRQEGGGSDPATSANLMDKKLALGAQFDTLKQNEAKSVNDQRNQATLMNTNQSNAYNTREADRLAQFRQEKGQVAGQYTDRLQDLYKSSVEDKYKALGAKNQYDLAVAAINSGNTDQINNVLKSMGLNTNSTQADKDAAMKKLQAQIDSMKKQFNMQ